jgi:hypothetical protein
LEFFTISILKYGIGTPALREGGHPLWYKMKMPSTPRDGGRAGDRDFIILEIR